VTTREAGGGMFSICPPLTYSDSLPTKFASLIAPASAKLTESAAVLFATDPTLKSSLPVSVVLKTSQITPVFDVSLRDGIVRVTVEDPPEVVALTATHGADR